MTDRSGDRPPHRAPAPLRPARRVRRGRALTSLLLAGSAVALAACGGDGSSDASAEAAAAPTSTARRATTTAATTTTPPTTSTVPPTTSTTVAPTTTAIPTTEVPTTTAAPETTTTLPQLTEPIPPPADSYRREPQIELGRIQIPKLGVDMAMYEGIRMPTLDKGPGHWPGSAMPGQVGNVVVAGHRTSKHRVFRHIDLLVPGDEIIFVDANGRHVYRVRGTEIVWPDAMWIVNPTPTATATLFACHPPGSVAQRIVVYADLVTA